MSTLAERFWTKVEQRGPDECWPWLGYVAENGYGRFSVGGRAGRMEGAHRVAFRLTHGRWPLAGYDVDHTCHNRDPEPRGASCLHARCVNPGHLEEVTHQLNNQRGRARFNGEENRVKTHCPSGHPYDALNTRIKRTPRGEQRICRTCARQYARDHYQPR